MYFRSYLEIDEDLYRHNIRTLQALSGKKLIGVIKADGYGVDDLTCAHALIEEGVDFLAVSSLEEARHLRENGIGTKILILGYVDREDLPEVRREDLSIVTVSEDYVDDCGKELAGIHVHLKLNTGMNRIGVLPIEAPAVLEKLLKYGADVEGLMTHFVSSDDDEDFTRHQQELFKKTLDALHYDFRYIHTSNSDGTLHFPDDFTNYVRCGIALLGHGSYPSDLKPCVSLHSTVIDCKLIKAGESVSYGRHFTAAEDTWILTLPIGYADGFYRSNAGKEVYVEGEYGKIAGSVCMDQMMVIVKKPYPVHTDVEIYGPHIDIAQRASELGTITYELYTSLSDRLTRVVKKGGQITKVIRPRFD